MSKQDPTQPTTKEEMIELKSAMDTIVSITGYSFISLLIALEEAEVITGDEYSYLRTLHNPNWNTPEQDEA